MKQKHIPHAKRLSFREAVEKFKGDVLEDRFSRTLSSLTLKEHVKVNIIDHPFTAAFLGSKNKERLKQELVDTFHLVNPVVWLNDKKSTCITVKIPALGVDMDCGKFSLLICFVSPGGRISFTAEQAETIKNVKFYLEDLDNGGIACANGQPMEFTGLHNALKFMRYLLEKNIVNNFVARKQLRPFTQEEEMFKIDIEQELLKDFRAKLLHN